MAVYNTYKYTNQLDSEKHSNVADPLQEGRTLIGSDAAVCSQGIGTSRSLLLLCNIYISTIIIIKKHCALLLLVSFHYLPCNFTAVLRGPGLLAEHCALENRDGVVTMFPRVGALCSVDGSPVEDACQLTQGESRPFQGHLPGRGDTLQ